MDRRRDRRVRIADSRYSFSRSREATPDAPRGDHRIVPAVNTLSVVHDFVSSFRCTKNARVLVFRFPPFKTPEWAFHKPDLILAESLDEIVVKVGKFLELLNYLVRRGV